MNLETGTVSLKTLLLVAIGVFGIGIAWQAVLGAQTEHTKQIEAIRQTVAGNQIKMDKLTFVICMETPDSVARCRSLGLVQ